jgi:hypothetical protein
MKAELEIDMYTDIEPEGIIRSLYIGEGSCEPTFQDVESWEEIIERTIGYYRIPNDDTIAPGDAEELEKIVAGLEHAIALFKEKIAQHKE